MCRNNQTPYNGNCNVLVFNGSRPVINRAAFKHDWTTQLLQLHASLAPRTKINGTTDSTTSLASPKLLPSDVPVGSFVQTRRPADNNHVISDPRSGPKSPALSAWEIVVVILLMDRSLNGSRSPLKRAPKGRYVWPASTAEASLERLAEALDGMSEIMPVHAGSGRKG